MLKDLTPGNEGLQELINPVPLELIVDEDEDFEMSIEIDEMIAAENEAVRDVLEMLEDTVELLDTGDSGKPVSNPESS